MADTVERARDAFARQAWADAYALTTAAEAGGLEVEDLERRAVAAYLIGKDEESARAWEEAHRERLRADDPAEAARCAFWLALGLLFRGEPSRGGGWLARATRIVDERDLDCAARGYLLVPAIIQALEAGDTTGAAELAARAHEIGRRFDDPDLLAFSTLAQGQASMARGDTTTGAALLDEVMVSVTTGEVSPIPAGIVYCAVVETCMRVHDLARAVEWTDALTRWCDGQPDLVPYRGQCLVHRSQILQVHGRWSDAIAAAEQARDWLTQPPHPALGAALYQQAELHRLRGEGSEAEAAYRQAGQHGRDPMPGLALLRLTEGRIDAAVAAIRRAVQEPADLLQRPTVLAAAVEILRAAGDVAAARAAADELARTAKDVDAPLLVAMAAHASGSVLLAEGDPGAALTALRVAFATWVALEMPYEAARTRVLIGLADAALGDQDAAELQLSAACSTFDALGAEPELARVTAMVGTSRDEPAGSLTAREREVLRLVAAGMTNRDIASELVISEHTAARHLQNIFTKLSVSSRAAATARAYERGLL